MPLPAHHTTHPATHPAANAFWLDSVFGPPPVREIVERIESDLIEQREPLQQKIIKSAWTQESESVDIQRLAPSENLASLIHDTRSMVSAIDLYCDLLEEPGVLSEPFRQYSAGLRHVGATSRRLLESMLEGMPETVPETMPETMPETRPETRPEKGPETSASKAPPIQFSPGQFSSLWPSNSATALSPVSFPVSNPISSPVPSPARSPFRRDPQLSPSTRRRALPAGKPVASLASELRANLNLISALVGPSITVGLAIEGGDRPVAMAVDDLTRVLVNLARNAADAMPEGGHIQIALEERFGHMSLSIADTGPGIPEAALESIFVPGFTTNIKIDPVSSGIAWPVQHRGLGLFIVRSIVAAAGGLVWAGNRANLLPGEAPAEAAMVPVASSSADSPAPVQASPLQTGAILWIEFPVSLTRAEQSPGIT
jgi:signal transduction histidine kinase